MCASVKLIARTCRRSVAGRPLEVGCSIDPLRQTTLTFLRNVTVVLEMDVATVVAVAAGAADHCVVDADVAATEVRRTARVATNRETVWKAKHLAIRGALVILEEATIVEWCIGVRVVTRLVVVVVVVVELIAVVVAVVITVAVGLVALLVALVVTIGDDTRWGVVVVVVGSLVAFSWGSTTVIGGALGASGKLGDTLR